MNTRFAYALMIALSFGLCSQLACGQSPATDDPIESMARSLAERITADTKERPKVTVLDFTDMQRRQNEAGRYLALELANYMVNLKSVAVLDRANLETIMAEHQLTVEGLLKPEDAKKLGNFAGVDAILIGELSVQSDGVKLFVRAISTETSEILASGKATLQTTNELRKMLGIKVSSQAVSPSDSTRSAAVATEGEAIAQRTIGPVRATLRNVAEVQIPNSNSNSSPFQPSGSTGSSTPAIRCTFALENLNLDKSVAIAANQGVANDHELTMIGYRGGLIDSTQGPWKLFDVRGISAIAAFDASKDKHRWSIKQSNPGGVVEYVTSGTSWNDRIEERQPEKRFWNGSFSVIDPGETVDLTVTFMFSGQSDQKGRPVSAQTTRPDSFEFNMELVLGTLAPGESPAKAKDLKLRNLTIDKVMLPAESSGSVP
jgi:TolB-like protein